MLIAGRLRRDAPWHPQLDARVRNRKALGHHAHDPERSSFDGDGASDDRRISAELLLPERVGQHDDRIWSDRSRGIVELGTARLFDRERPPEDGRHLHHRKEILGHLRADQDFGVARDSQRPADRVVTGDAIEHGRPLAPVHEVARRHAGSIDADLGVLVEDPDETFGIRVRQRTQDNAVDEREENGPDANPYALCSNRQKRHAGRGAQNSSRVNDLPRQLFYWEARATLGQPLASRSDAAKLNSSLPTRFRFVDATAHFLDHNRLDMVRELIGGVAVQTAGEKQFDDAAPHASHGVYSTSAWSTRIIAAAVRSHAA